MRSPITAEPVLALDAGFADTGWAILLAGSIVATVCSRTAKATQKGAADADASRTQHLARYLSDRTMAAIAWSLGTSENELWNALGHGLTRPSWLSGCVRKVLSGNATKANGQPYQPLFEDSIWDGLAHACRRPELLAALTTLRAGANLAALSYEVAVPPTGRLRANVVYTEARNTPFQGLASDGAKIACFELLRAGYRVVGFIHDEFIIELPVEANHAHEAKRIEQIVCDGMGAAINGAVPVGVEFALSTCWSKGAKAIYDKQGRLMPWSPKQTRVE